MAGFTDSVVLPILVMTLLAEYGGTDRPDVGPLSASVVIPSIVNGWDAGEGRWPWQISLMVKSPHPGRYIHSCGGVLLTRNFVLSAAHCTQSPADEYLVVIGHYDFAENPGPDKQRLVRNITNHPSYISAGRGHDISLIELETPAVFTDNAQPAFLPDTDDTFVGAECYISGWGKLGGWISDGFPDKLQELRIPVISNADCRSRIGIIQNFTVHSSNICLYDGKGGSCQGDSGGPLHCRLCQNDPWVVAGVTSWGVGNLLESCLQRYPSVYTRTSSYVPWIRSIVGNDIRFPNIDVNETCIAIYNSAIVGCSFQYVSWCFPVTFLMWIGHLW